MNRYNSGNTLTFYSIYQNSFQLLLESLNINSQELDFGTKKMTNKFTKQFPQNHKVCRKKRKINQFKTEQHYSIYQNLSMIPRKNLKKKNEGKVHEGNIQV